MSRRDLLIGLQHATQQGIKMRENTNLAEANTARIPVREPNATMTHAPGSNLELSNYTDSFKAEVNSDIRGDLKRSKSQADMYDRIAKRQSVSPSPEKREEAKETKKEAESWRNDSWAVREQRRREDNEKKMRELSAPDSALRREPELPSELKKESYSNRRLGIILETVSQILEATGMRQRVVSGGRQRGDEGSVRYARRRKKTLEKDKEEGWVRPESREGDDLPIPGRRKRFRVSPKARED